MSRKFATVSGFRVVLALISVTILAGATTVHAQQTPAQPPPPAPQPHAQQPGNQQSSSQEASPEEIGPTRKPKVKEYKNWTFNVGGGASLTNGATRTFVRGGGGIAAAGVAVGHADVREFPHHGQIHFAAALVARYRQRAERRAVIALLAAEDLVARGLSDFDLILASQLERGL